MTLSRRNQIAPFSRDFLASIAPAETDSRSFAARFATDQIARDGHRILGWTLDNFLRNPVVQFAHDVSQPPIARAVGLVARGGNLSGTIVFPEPGVSEFADTICALVAAGFLRATSVSWNPIEYRYATEKGRAPKAVDFTQCDLLEISVVPVGSDTGAMIGARAAGIDTGPLYQWAERALDERRSPVPRPQLETLRREAKMPVTQLRTREQREARAAQLRAEIGMEQTTFRSFGEFLQAVANSNTSIPDARLMRAPHGANETDLTAGGFAVPAVWADQLISSVYGAAVLAPLCDRRETAAPLASHKIPGIDETSRADGSRWGGATAYWANEADSISPSGPRYRMVELGAKKLIAASIASSELVADAMLLEGTIRKAFAAEMGFKLDRAILAGPGTGQPLGLLNSSALITVAKETGQAAGTIVAENIDNMWSRLPAPSRRNAIWLVNEEAEGVLSKLNYVVGTGGTPAPSAVMMYPPNAGPPTMKGRPVIAIEQASALGSVGDIVLCDPSQYLLLDGGLKFAVSVDVRFDSDEVTFRFTWRVDGAPAWASPITPYNGTATRSPFVALAAR